MKSTPTARWAGSHPTNTRANGHNTTNNNQQPSKHPVHKTRPDQLIMSSLSSISGTKLSQHTHTSSPTGTKLSQHTHTSSPTGTKLSQHAKNCPFQPVLPEQGELCTAATTKKSSRENFLPHPAPPPIQNSPNTPTPAAQPVQNSPNTPKIAHFSPFCPSRENFVPLAPPRPPAGRTLYRT